ncbi:hypothetical protein E2320_009171 [Naja naja]|nr:hypothetical protein E2320_009171 [Naja naja]
MKLTKTGPGVNCLESMCCFSDGEPACTPFRRMLERIMRRCSPTRVNRSWSSTEPFCTSDGSFLTLSTMESIT